jgi:hypothetical protein
MPFYKKEHLKAKDYEMKYLPTLQTYLNDDTIKNIPDTFGKFDFKGENKFIEMKQRNVNSTTYKDTMMPLNKINYCLQHPDIEFYFVILFNDGLFIWKYDVNATLNYRVGGRNDRLQNEMKDYAFIPIEFFTKI